MVFLFISHMRAQDWRSGFLWGESGDPGLDGALDVVVGETVGFGVAADGVGDLLLI